MSLFTEWISGVSWNIFVKICVKIVSVLPLDYFELTLRIIGLFSVEQGGFDKFLLGVGGRDQNIQTKDLRQELS